MLLQLMQNFLIEDETFSLGKEVIKQSYLYNDSAFLIEASGAV